ncbi:uncharacterized protein B0H18DRAFT_1104641 [Fomitopsis serialis]|uniref:uncharacterized protein n=1 Tax=Fomitopsis serialis TaxID=139415 RepID=UPI0020084E76|nr:uncharacterized protein B0H18DRAFT_1104641 [Neoantrodia serialis]KAH9925826.1 hypothetical protein B0H18DRAFT_1104641 [Neoantrodia serialis]
MFTVDRQGKPQYVDLLTARQPGSQSPRFRSASSRCPQDASMRCATDTHHDVDHRISSHSIRHGDSAKCGMRKHVNGFLTNIPSKLHNTSTRRLGQPDWSLTASRKLPFQPCCRLRPPYLVAVYQLVVPRSRDGHDNGRSDDLDDFDKIEGITSVPTPTEDDLDTYKYTACVGLNIDRSLRGHRTLYRLPLDPLCLWLPRLEITATRSVPIHFNAQNTLPVLQQRPVVPPTALQPTFTFSYPIPGRVTATNVGHAHHFPPYYGYGDPPAPVAAGPSTMTTTTSVARPSRGRRIESPASRPESVAMPTTNPATSDDIEPSLYTVNRKYEARLRRHLQVTHSRPDGSSILDSAETMRERSMVAHVKLCRKQQAKNGAKPHAEMSTPDDSDHNERPDSEPSSSSTTSPVTAPAVSCDAHTGSFGLQPPSRCGRMTSDSQVGLSQGGGMDDLNRGSNGAMHDTVGVDEQHYITAGAPTMRTPDPPLFSLPAPGPDVLEEFLSNLFPEEDTYEASLTVSRRPPPRESTTCIYHLSRLDGIFFVNGPSASEGAHLLDGAVETERAPRLLNVCVLFVRHGRLSFLDPAQLGLAAPPESSLPAIYASRVIDSHRFWDGNVRYYAHLLYPVRTLSVPACIPVTVRLLSLLIGLGSTSTYRESAVPCSRQPEEKEGTAKRSQIYAYMRDAATS